MRFYIILDNARRRGPVFFRLTMNRINLFHTPTLTILSFSGQKITDSFYSFLIINLNESIRNQFVALVLNINIKDREKI